MSDEEKEGLIALRIFMTTGNESNGQRHGMGLVPLFNLVMLAALFVALAWGYLAPGPESSGLAHRVDVALVDSGVESRVTAVLLNYRAYDTLLECFVILVGVVVVWSLRPVRYGRHDPGIGLILSSLVRLLVPLMVLISAYLLWAGSNQAGGAFQAGAILGGAGVLLLLTSSPLLSALPKGLLSCGICLGPVFFLLIGLGTMGLGHDFMGYRGQAATLVIVALEAVTALSIGLSLAALFVGRGPEEPQEGAVRDESFQDEGGEQ